MTIKQKGGDKLTDFLKDPLYVEYFLRNKKALEQQKEREREEEEKTVSSPNFPF